MRIAIFVTTAVAVYGLTNYYIGLRAFQYIGAGFPSLSGKLYWPVFWLIALSVIYGRLPFTGVVKNFLVYVGSYWMAVMFYAVILLAATDGIKLAMRLSGVLKSQHINNFNLYTGIVLSIAMTGIIIYGTLHAAKLQVKEYHINLSGAAGPSGDLRAVLISDLHLGRIVTRPGLDAIIDRVNSLKPDMVFITGDIIDDEIKPFINRNMAASFRRLKARQGVYGIPGNHDGYGSDLDRVVEEFEKAGITMLRDTYILVDNSIYVAGRDYPSMGSSKSKRKPLGEILKEVDKQYPVILLDHEPANLHESKREGVDLQLSGHTHGGQIFPAGLITRLIYKQDWGYYKSGRFQLIVTSGAATWGPPLRVGTDSEIVSLKITFT